MSRQPILRSSPNPSAAHRYLPALAAGLVALLFLTACFRPATMDQAQPMPTAVTPLDPVTDLSAPLILRDANLLTGPHVALACDASDATAIDCVEDGATPHLHVDVSAADYARWSLRWDYADGVLSGDETLAVRLTHQGNLAPTLYLVEQDGTRIGTRLAQFGLPEGAHTLYIPLAELRDFEDRTADFAAVTELQLVFEWDDMAGTLAIEDMRFLSVWSMPVTVGHEAATLAATLAVPPGFGVTPIVDDLREMTQFDFTPDGDLLVSLQNGRIWWYTDSSGDGRYDERRLYATGFTEVVGLLVDPADGAVWVGGRGQLLHALDSSGNGVADIRTVRVDGMPWGRHQNNDLIWNPDPDPFSGEPGGTWLYFGLGSVDDMVIGGDYNATVLRFPRHGQGFDDLEIVSRGNRNAYGLLWANLPLDPADPDGPRGYALFAGENGPDYSGEPDEVNHIRWGRHYGFPEQFGHVEDPAQEDNPYSGPVYAVAPHASANELAYIDHPAWPSAYRTLYVSLFGSVFSPTPVGHTVERITLHAETLPNGELTYRGEPDEFITGLNRPLPLASGPDGHLWVGDYATGVIYRIAYGE